MTSSGEHLETVRISNDREHLQQVMARAGEAPEGVLEATHGWYWAADSLAELGARVHLAHPLGVKMFALRRAARTTAAPSAASMAARPAPTWIFRRGGGCGRELQACNFDHGCPVRG